jgi:hypoxanthine-guanine phosphoribosyltransferase
LIVEDIYDTGHTMKKMISSIIGFGAKNVKTCVLLHKKNVQNIEY